MAKPEWGTKRLCTGCGDRFYDLQRDPIVCPKCGVVFDPEQVTRLKRARNAPPPDPKPKPAVVAANDDDAEASADDDAEDIADETDDDVLATDDDDAGDDIGELVEGVEAVKEKPEE